MDIAFTSFLVIIIIISIVINIYLYTQLQRYQVNDRSHKAKWQEVMGLHNPVNLLVWFFLTVALFLGTIVLIVEVFNL
jgi:ABC-type Fe3+ transport system permease subunit